MKTLYLMRHAKSSWKDASLIDADRPLNKRGEHDAPFMGQLLAERGVIFDEIISSPAERSLATLQYICPLINFPFTKVKISPALYDASTMELIIVIKEIDVNIKSVLLVGHNPGLTELANYLSGNPIDNIPTCGVVELFYKRKTWQEIELGSCETGFFEYPKKYFKK
jgi:phosphohistidine phosphatase